MGKISAVWVRAENRLLEKLAGGRVIRERF